MAPDDITAPNLPDEANRSEADIKVEGALRVAELQRDLRLLQWMTGVAIVLAATVLFRVSTH